MSKIIFSKAAMSDLYLERGRLYPVSKPQEKHQERHLTESMNPKVVSYPGTLTLWQLEFNYLSQNNYDGTTHGLKTWFENSLINYSENSFTLTDEDGVTHTVRLWQDVFDMKRHGSGRYSISLTLIKE